MKLAIVALALALAACNTPTPKLRLGFAGGPSQECPSTHCADVPMMCKSVMSIRIVDPTQAASPYLWQCVEVAVNHDKTMCALETVDLEPTQIPVRDLEVQVAVYPLSEIQPDPTNPALLC